MAKPLRAFLIADIRLYREGLAECLSAEGIDVVGTADRWPGSVGHAKALPDVYLLDMAAPDGLEIARAIAALAPGTKVVALAVPETEAHVISCAEAGIAGYVSRDGSVRDLIAALEHTTRGEAICAPHIVGGLLRRVGALAGQRAPRAAAGLTPREFQIVSLIDEGKSNKEIAAHLSIQVPTVKNHVHRILEKLQVRRRSEAAARVRGMHVP